MKEDWADPLGTPQNGGHVVDPGEPCLVTVYCRKGLRACVTLDQSHKNGCRFLCGIFSEQ